MEGRRTGRVAVPLQPAMISATTFTPRRQRPSAPEVVLVVAFAGIWLLHDLMGSALNSALFLVLLFVSYAALVASDVLGRRRNASRELSIARLLLVAVLLRLFVGGLAFDLSDDVYRYLWDGRVLLAGANPYATSPDDPALVSLRDDLWQLTAHREVETVYPPAAQALFALANLAAESSGLPRLFVWRLLVGLLDLIGCALLWHLCRVLKLPTGRARWYAWNPLVVLEGVGMGHLDVPGGALLITALLLLVAKRSTTGQTRNSLARTAAAGLAVAVAILIKLVPLVALGCLAGLARNAREALTFLLSCAAACAAACLPVVVSVGGVPPGLVRYGVSWEFNGPLFEPLWRLLDAVDATTRVKSLVGWLEGWSHLDLGGVYSWVYPQLMAKMLLAVVLALVLLALLLGALRSRDTTTRLHAVHRSLVAALLCSATLYPWYAVWAVPTAALLRDRAWLTVSAAIQLAYLPRLFGVAYHPWVYLAIWAPSLAVALWLAGRRRRTGEPAP